MRVWKVGMVNYRAAKTSISAEARSPSKHGRRSVVSDCSALAILSPSLVRNVNLNGSATQASTSRNSSGAWTHEVRSNASTALEPLMSSTSIRVAPRLKNPNKPPVKRENALSSRRLRTGFMGGVQRTFTMIRAYRKERTTGMQLFRKIRDTRAMPPHSLTVRTGPMTRILTRASMNTRNPKENAVRRAPASDPTPKAARVAPNAISMNFMGNYSS